MKKENKKLAQEQRAKQRKKELRTQKLQSVLKFVIPAVVIVLLIALILWNPFAKDTNTTTDMENTSNTTASSEGTYTPPALDETLTYYADIQIKDYGTVTIKLDQETAPVSSANFVALANDGFYDGLTFHRIIEDFMMQGGDPNRNGTGGSENNIVGEFSENGHKNDLSHTRGAVSMARSSDNNSASSQFFIVHKDSTYLDGQYAVFGYVTEGMEVVDEICESAEPTDNNGTIPADAQPIITSVKIRTE